MGNAPFVQQKMERCRSVQAEKYRAFATRYFDSNRNLVSFVFYKARFTRYYENEKYPPVIVFEIEANSLSSAQLKAHKKIIEIVGEEGYSFYTQGQLILI